jgi:purine-nucleoside phosphorylase
MKSAINYKSIAEAANEIKAHLRNVPEIGIILGTGYSAFEENIKVEFEINYEKLPQMRPSTNPIHPGKFVFGKLFDKNVVCMVGRIHTYEGYEACEVAFPVFLMRELGICQLIVTNAAGAIKESLSPKQFSLISDHINFTGKTPLPFLMDERVGKPCPDMSYAYAPRLRKLFKEAAQRSKIDLDEGVYIGVMGPSFETPAEIRAFRVLGADLVGMSTIPEVIAAASCGIECVGISLVTNMAAGMLNQPISLDDINAIDDRVISDFSKLLEAAFKNWSL